jgi:hypothetical protein
LSTVTRTAADRLEMAILRKYRTPGAALAALGFDGSLINNILQEDKTMQNRRLARDDTMPDDERAEWMRLLEALSPDDREELRKEFEARAREADPGYEPDPALDRRRRLGRDRRRISPAMDSNLPSFAKLWPTASAAIERRRIW